ncbi:MAG: enoyl-CoA hydratase/isomerase family protein [Elusimicrobia bacterium]|nr:enoyl-CoA hydratase/isomerase family protein [Elusimicrobiota bacterium]
MSAGAGPFSDGAGLASRAPIASVGVVGAGTMGSGIAQKLAMEGLPVVLVDVSQDCLNRGMARIDGMLREGVERRVLRAQEAEAARANLACSSSLSALRGCELVIEAIYEDLAAKRALFKDLGRACRESAILATNTSSFSVTELAGAASGPERVLGLHFFYHPVKNRLVELVRGEASSEDAAARLGLFCRKLGAVVLEVKDRPGFAVNRFFVPWLNEAVRLLEEGPGCPASIDDAARAAFGVGLGPFALMNATGVPVACHAAESLGRALGPFYSAAERLKRQTEAGRAWELQGCAPASERVGPRLWGAVWLAAGSMLEEGVASREDIDRGAKVGLRWPEGPFEALERFGGERAAEWAGERARAWSVPLPKALRPGAAAPWRPRLVDLAREGALGRVTLNRPEALNALNPGLVRQLEEAVDRAVADPAVKVVALEGAGKAFAAGADVKFFIDAIDAKDLDRVCRFTEEGQRVFLKLERCPKPIVACLNGMALGGGAELALACRYRVATPKTVFRFPETGIGLYPGLGGTQRLPRLIGKAMAKYFIFTGAAIPAALALELGLVDRVCEFERLGEEALRLAAASPRRRPGEGHLAACGKGLCRCVVDREFSDERVERLLRRPSAPPADAFGKRTAESLAKKAPVALALANRVMDQGWGLRLEDSLALELKHLREVFATQDAYEGLTSIGKRPPVFRGL